MKLTSRYLVALAMTLLIIAASPGPGAADDRDLLRSSSQDPFVFVILDLSGSMHLSVPCSAEDVAAGNCSLECPIGGCLPPFIGDDPNSRLRTAKEAIFEIMEETEGVHFGFAAFDHDGMRVEHKHWWYRVAALSQQIDPLITLQSGRVYPDVGHGDVFGQTWGCNAGTGPPGDRDADNIGCSAQIPADLDDAWESTRVRRWPKLDNDLDTRRTFYIRDTDNEIYEVEYTPLTSGGFSGQSLGEATLGVEVRIERCTNSDCSSFTRQGLSTVIFERVGDFIHYEGFGTNVLRVPPQQSFFGSDTRQVAVNAPGADGLEKNNDTARDGFSNQNLKQPTLSDPFDPDFNPDRGAAFSIGDFIPFDWMSDQRELIKLRMAPNLQLPGETVPDFGVASYFENQPSPGESFLRLRDSVARPLIQRGGTPTGRAMEEFRMWLADWLDVATQSTNGDPRVACRSLNLVVVTDGLASDGDSACGHANQLRNFVFGGTPFPVRSFAVALGNTELRTQSRNNVLNCIADNGGTGTGDVDGDGQPDGPGPLFPDNKDEMIAAFREIFEAIAERNRSFAAAAVPQAQANTADKIFLTSFTPVPSEPIWAGRIDGYERPIPLRDIQVTLDDGTTETRLVPDRDRLCVDADDSGCRLWDAGTELLALAPSLPDPGLPGPTFTATDFQIGTGGTERRVIYGVPVGNSVPASRSFFAPGSNPLAWQDLLTALGLCDPTAADFVTCAADAANQDRAEAMFHLLYNKKTFRNPETGQDESYVLGDVFHSNPRILGPPSNFQYFVADFFGNGQPCSATGADFNPGYRCFFERHRFRRNLLLVGSNEGQLHAFEAGIFQRDGTATPVQGQFDNGSGRELFAFVPRTVMPTLVDWVDPAIPQRHEFTVDGSPVTADVFIDPSHAGVPTPGDRQWRSVVVGGLREGGAGYYALDLTQPDELDADDVPQPASSGVLPSCEGGGTDCGPNSWPAILWDFNDSQGCNAVVDGRCDDEDNGDGTFGNGLPDLGDSWSVPNVGIIEVCDGAPCQADNLVRKFVAIFGGGMDPEHKDAAQQRGNWLYMVDVETGRVLYKRQLAGSTPSTPAAVDTDQDGVLDTVYIGTVKGLLYKVDLATAVPVIDVPGKGPRIVDTTWDPFPIFTTDGRPMFFPPAVVFIAARAQFAVAFGTGDREDLWQQAPNDDGRFYLFVDEGLEATTVGIPFSESDLEEITVGGPSVGQDTDFLLAPTADLPGWFLPLANDERVITQAFALGGVTVFSTFVPTLDTNTVGGQEVVCANRGSSRVYVLFTNNADPVFDSGDRFRVVPDLVTEPFTEVGQIKNASGNSSDPTADDLSDNLREIMESLKSTFPESCRFANFTINVKALRSDTGVEFIAPVPVCITQRNWKEF